MKGKTKLTTGITSGTSQNWTNFIAQEKGFFEREGLDHNYVSTGDMREGMEQLTRGNVPIMTAMADTPILEIEKGAKIRIIASVVRAGFGHIVSAPECKRFEQLRGRDVAVIDLQSGSTVILREILRKNGLNDQDYTLRQVGGTPKRYEALKRGEVTAAFLSPPYDFQAESEGMNLLADYAEYFPSYPLTINVNSDFSHTYPDIVMKYLRAMVKASQWIYDEKNREVAVAVLEKSTHISRHFAEKTYDYVVKKIRAISPDCHISASELEQVIALLVKAGLLEERSSRKAADFLDLTYLERIRKAQLY